MSSKGNGKIPRTKKKAPKKEQKLGKILRGATQAKNRPIRDRSNASTRLLQCARQFLDPTSCEDLQICPDESSQPRCIRRIPKTFTITRDPANSVDGFTIIVQPRLVSPIWMTGQAGYYPNAGYSGDCYIKSIAHPAVAPSNGVVNSLWPHYYRAGQYHNKNSAVMPITVLEGVVIGGNPKNLNIIPIEVDPLGIGGPIYFSLDNEFSTDVIRSVEWYSQSVADGDWTYEGLTSTSVTAVSNVVPINRAGIINVGFAILALTTQEFDISMTVDTDSRQLRFPRAATNVFNASTALADLGPELKGGRVVGISLLAQNTTAEISKQGKVYAIRCPGKMNPYTPVEELQNIVPANYYYDGPAAKGGYVWWFPGSYEPLKYQETELATQYLDEDAYLMIAVRGWGGSEVGSAQPTFSIQVTAIVEFYDPGVLFEKIPPPLPSEAWNGYKRILGALPAATCNPMHTTLMERLQKMLHGAGSAAYGLYQQNPELVRALYTLVSTL